ncbi:MAG TPA: bifunctional phosphoribosylaminoimidazolecarboxamide formyltransferase/IMP cyclohydrolase [Pyrinomonadaceae bacterium]|nr:bifunctional phosphoribosylaminoimidazolecarboxamide formyltransferase/IMP cyclohydrolase [Pyrinomonadaceae bacterium]
MTELRKIKRALISVSDKAGLLEFVGELAKHGVEIISTGGTAAHIRNNGFTVTDVSEVTGFPEMMDGRVKTLHPKIHGAFLALRDNEDHVASMLEHGITPIDLVVVNLYPFEQTIVKQGVSLEEAVENIDIGGPAMIRSASKNWRDVAVVTEVAIYPEIVAEMAANDGSLSLETRSRLAASAFKVTSWYDAAIASYLNIPLAGTDGVFGYGFAGPSIAKPAKTTTLRYGENPHQDASLISIGENGIANAEQLHGKEMSFNNYVDADAAWALVNDFDETAVAIIKHTNPSGVGVGSTNLEAYKRALSTDPVSAFGGIVALNRKVDTEVAAAIIEVFSEVIIAPDYDDDALEIFRSKKNLRVLRIDESKIQNSESKIEYKQISGGFLVQDADVHRLSLDELNIVTERQPTGDELKAMQLAWTVCKHVKSNAIVFANGVQTLGVGAGQMNRVDSVRIAAMRAERFEFDLGGCALASDAFFPFRDNVDEAARFGVKAIIQPGGSIKDDESIAAANEHGITMAFTGIRHFKH